MLPAAVAESFNTLPRRRWQIDGLTHSNPLPTIMTSVVSNPSGRKSAKDRKVNPSKTASAMHSATATTHETDSINNPDEFGRKNDKFQVVYLL